MKIERLKGYEDDYLIDELGNVVTIPRTGKATNQYNTYHVLNGRIDQHGYVKVSLTKDGESKDYLVHRLVATQFIPNDSNLPQVNHIDGIKTNNAVENLEWCTAQQNKQHAYDNNISETKTKALAALQMINSQRAYRNIRAQKDGEVMYFSDTNEAAAYFHCHKDKVSSAIKHNKVFHGYVLTCHRPCDANEVA